MSELINLTVQSYLFVWWHRGHKRVLVFSSDMACSVAGITSDANVLTNELRLIAQR